ncbi:ABC transporter substrate-binding protein, partial [Saccharothrix xinjiangensis]
MVLRAGRFSRTRTVVAGLSAVAALLAGCGGSAPNDAEDRDTLVLPGAAGDFQLNFNPFSPTLLEGPGTIFEPLFFFNNTRDVEPRPRLAESFRWNADGTRLDVELRDGVKWSDGRAFTAADVVFTFDMITRNPGMNGTGYRGTATAVDDTTVSIEFPEPSYLEGPQVLGKVVIVPRHRWEGYADPASEALEEPVGTGPFVLEEFKAQAFTLRANPTYWGGEPAVKKVRYISLSGNQAIADALKAGRIDWQSGPVPDIANVEENYPGYKAITVPMNQTALFTCSNAALGCQGPQTDVAVRKAIYYAINRTQVNALAFENTSSEISPGAALLGRDEAQISTGLRERAAPMRPDVAKATAALESAGYAKGSDG